MIDPYQVEIRTKHTMPEPVDGEFPNSLGAANYGEWCQRESARFNAVEKRNGGSRVAWTQFSEDFSTCWIEYVANARGE